MNCFKLAQVVLAYILLIWWLKDWQFFKDESFSLPTYKEKKMSHRKILKNEQLHGDHPKRSSFGPHYGIKKLCT